MINWTKGCMSSIAFVVLINGSGLSFFEPSWGSRQRCLLAPLLFSDYFPVLEQIYYRGKKKRLSWRVRVGDRVRIGADPWVGNRDSFKLQSPSSLKRISAKSWDLNIGTGSWYFANFNHFSMAARLRARKRAMEGLYWPASEMPY